MTENYRNENREIREDAMSGNPQVSLENQGRSSQEHFSKIVIYSADRHQRPEK